MQLRIWQWAGQESVGPRFSSVRTSVGLLMTHVSLLTHYILSSLIPEQKKEMKCEKEIWRFQFAVWPSWVCHGPLCFPSPLWIIDEVDDSHVNRQSGPAWTWGQQAAGCHWCWWWRRSAPCWPPPSWPASTRRTAAPCTLVTSQHAPTPTSWPPRQREVRLKTEKSVELIFFQQNSRNIVRRDNS